MIRPLAIGAAVVCLDLLGGTVSVPAAGAGPLGRYVRTESGEVRCWVSTTDQDGSGDPTVICQHGPGFPQAPINSTGNRDDCAKVVAPGTFTWLTGDIGSSANELTLTYGRIFQINGWTISPNADGTRFTNIGTGHGMFVSVQDVSSF